MTRRPGPGPSRAALAALVLVLAGATPAAGAPQQPVVSATPAAAPAASQKLRADLADLVAGATTPDPRIASLVPGHRADEIPYFVVLNAPNDAARRAELEALGVRVLRQYRSVTAFAVASDAATVLRVAARPDVAWLAPVELVHALADEPLADQTRGTPRDIGADALWEAGITGSGVRIAILDTGLDRAHPDLDDLDFRHWSAPLSDPKLVDARDFNGGACNPMLTDDHGHGTHVAGIATGTGEGTPLAEDDGRHTGLAPGAELAVGKVLTDAGAGINSDLIAALEWAAMPEDRSPAGCAIGADIVNLSLGSEARPGRLNSDADVDLVSLVLNRLAVRYGTLFTAAAGNSGPFIGSVLEAPGSAAQALSVAASAKDWDLNHDDTASGDTCAGYRHPPSEGGGCSAGAGNQDPSISSFSSRGPAGDLWLRPDLSAPGYNIVSAQASAGVPLAQNDLNRGTRGDPLYATATGTSMAAPATAGSAALLLEAYRTAHGGDPRGASGLPGLEAPPYVLLRAALMNSAGGDQLEGRWILSVGDGTGITCPPELEAPTFGLCSILADFVGTFTGSLTLYEVRNGADDPYVGPLGEGAGKLNVERALAALRDGVVIYSAASASGELAGTGHRDFQGSWQIGPVGAGSHLEQRFVLHAAPSATAQQVSFAFEGGHPSDGSRAIPTTGEGAWTVSLPPTTDLAAGDALVSLSVTVPADAPPGSYTGTVLAITTSGQRLRIPVFASVALHDPDPAAGNAPGPQAMLASARDVFGKADTVWPSAAGAAGGAGSDWLVYPVDLAAGLSTVAFAVHDAATGDETYDLYLYDERLDLVASTHPFAAPGVTDVTADGERPPSTATAPQLLTVRTPAAGRHYLAVGRSRIGGTTPGDRGAFMLQVDEVAGTDPPAADLLSYEGDRAFVQGRAGLLAARLTDADGRPIAGRAVTFTLGGGQPCPGGCTAVTDYAGRAMVATDPIALPAGVHEVTANFAGDDRWQPATADGLAIVLAATPPPLPVGGGRISAAGWISGATAAATDRVQFAFQASSGAITPSGDLRWRDRGAGIDLTLAAFRAMTISGDEVTLEGSGRLADGTTVSFLLTAHDAGEPGHAGDTVRLRLPGRAYDRSGVLGGGNVRLDRG